MVAASPEEPEPPDLQQVRRLFDRATELPATEREAFVRREAAHDPALRDAVLQLLAAGELDTGALRDGIGAADPEASPAGSGQDHVQSTATGELLEKLKTAPRLDRDRFVVEDELGQGGMGVVTRIHDRFLNRRLAMKVLLERRPPRDEEEQRLANQLLGRFLEEAQVTSQLDHPGVIPVHELGLDQSGKVYFTMRMVKGSTASERFEDAFHGRGEWNLTRGLEVILRVCDTMAYAHDKGVLHRDLKPGNVMVGRFGEVYVMDWGLAKVLGQQDRHDLRIRKDGETGVSRLETARKRDAEAEAENSVVSMDGQQLGTPSYMSPEQARSEELDARADVYSIGAMMYELATGSPPYVPRGIRKRAYLILEDVVLRPPERVEVLNKNVPAELVAVIEKAMARDREQRYRTVLELAADVRAFMAQRVVTAYRTGAWQETKLWVRRNKPLAASLAAAVLLLVGGVAVAASFGAAEAEAKAEAVMARRIAEKAQQVADLGFEALATKLAEFDQLALVVDYNKLIQEEAELCTAYPEQAEAIGDWLQRAQRLLGRKDELAAVVTAVQQSVVSETAKASAQFLGQSLGDLLAKLPKLAELVPAMQQRQRWAQAIGPLTLAHPNAKVTWAQARAAIAANPKYAGQDIPLRDRDVWGLVPIGENPQSKLWEFYDLRSAWNGSASPSELPLPTHQQDGRIKLTEDLGVIWVLLPGGTLPAGTEDQHIYTNERKPSVRLGVHLDPFFLSKFEITHIQWQRWTGTSPSWHGGGISLYPVTNIDWTTACATLRRFGWILPSELQWEYSIRAGTKTRWWTGDDEKAVYRAENLMPSYSSSNGGLSDVGSLEPNPFGLFDMGGNVWELCHDELGDYGTERAGDGLRMQRSDDSLYRVGRGGSHGVDAHFGESGTRSRVRPYVQGDSLGVRPAKTARR